MRTTLRILGILAAVAAASSGATPPRSRAFADPPLVYDSFKDFSGTSNPTPGNIWTYGWTTKLAGTFNKYTWVGQVVPFYTMPEWKIGNGQNAPTIGCNMSGTDFTMGGIMHPATRYFVIQPGPNGEYNVIRWTAPAAGTYSVDAAFRALMVSGAPATTDVHVVHNGYALASSNINAYFSAGDILTYNAKVTVAAGDTVDFVVGWGSNANNSCDTTGLRVTITATDPDVPPPAAPSALTASVSTGNPIVLSWIDNSDNEDEFLVERSTDGVAFFWAATAVLNSTSYEDVATVPGTEYTYRVRAENSGGVSDWSNRATVTASSIAPAPRAPSELRVIAAARGSLELTWIDNSVDEIGFEVHRSTPGGEYALVASLPPGSWGFTETGLPPDMECEYGVRSLNAYRASGLCTASATTLPTLSVTATRADLKDSPKFGKDSLKVLALFDFLPESPDGLFDVLAEGIGLRVGPVDRPVVMKLPKNLDTWKVRGTKATWKSAMGSTPKYCIQVDTERRTVKASATGLELAAPAANPMRVSIAVGNDGGTARGDWETSKPGVFRLR